MNRRRKLLIVFGASVLAAPLASFAQQGKVWRVGFLSPRSRPRSLDSDYFGAFPRGMRDLGYVEGRNLIIEWRFADGEYGRLPGLAAELVKIKVDVIVAVGTPSTQAAMKATTTIPIVIASQSDPVGSGLVKSLAHPGGNITGLSNIDGDIGPKHLEMLLGMVPKLPRVAVLMNPDNSSHATILKTVQAAAQRSGVVVLPAEARTPKDIDSAFSVMTREHAGAVIALSDPLFTQQRYQIAEQAVKNRLPSASGNQEYAEAGGLLSYGQNRVELFRRAATYVDKIFKGAKPADLPVEQPTKVELVVNLKTARALGITIPQSILVRADRVIE